MHHGKYIYINIAVLGCWGLSWEMSLQNIEV